VNLFVHVLESQALLCRAFVRENQPVNSKLFFKYAGVLLMFSRVLFASLASLFLNDPNYSKLTSFKRLKLEPFLPTNSLENTLSEQ